jgi:hypothetical protein
MPGQNSAAVSLAQQLFKERQDKMKRPVLIITFMLAHALCAFSQGVFLQAGDLYTREFDDFQFQFHIPPDAPFDPRTMVLIGKLNFSGSFLLEAFEDNTAQPPIFTTNFVSQAGISSVYYFGPAWQDLQGVVRLTMLSGSMDLKQIMGTVILPSADVYSQTIIPVPEPSPLALLFLAVVPIWCSCPGTRADRRQTKSLEPTPE